MTKVRRNPLLQGLSGKFGEMAVFREVRGKMQMIALPDERKGLSEKQQVQVERFKRAHTYAAGQMKDPESKAEYTKGITLIKHNAYLVAMTDYLNPPTVSYIKTILYTGAVGDTITIKAKDDFKVARVVVEIIGADGNRLERGEASRYIYKPFIWKYKASVANPTLKGTVIKVRAIDMPNNEGRLEIVM